MGAQIGQCRQPAAEILRHHSRFQRTKPDPKIRHRPADPFDQLGYCRFPRQIHPPAGDFNAGNHNLPVVPPGQLPGLLHRQLQRSRAHRPPGVGNNTIGTEVHAAVLDLQHGPGPLLQPSGGKDLKFPAAQGVVHLFTVGVMFQGIQHLLDEGPPSAAAADDVYAQFPNRLRGVLGIAAADPDHRLGILPAAPADHRPVFLVRYGGHRAGVDDVGVAGFVEPAQGVAQLRDKVLHGLGFILVRLASEGIKSKFHIVKSTNIVLYSLS